MYAVTVSTSLLLTAYAVAGNDGVTYVVLVNKDPSNAAATSIQLGGPASRAVPLVLAGGGLDATSGITLGGAGIANDGSWAPPPAPVIAVSGGSFAVNVAPASAILLRVS
jgi:hypothetical protein